MQIPERLLGSQAERTKQAESCKEQPGQSPEETNIANLEATLKDAENIANLAPDAISFRIRCYAALIKSKLNF